MERTVTFGGLALVMRAAGAAGFGFQRLAAKSGGRVGFLPLAGSAGGGCPTHGKYCAAPAITLTDAGAFAVSEAGFQGYSEPLLRANPQFAKLVRGAFEEVALDDPRVEPNRQPPADAQEAPPGLPEWDGKPVTSPAGACPPIARAGGRLDARALGPVLSAIDSLAPMCAWARLSAPVDMPVDDVARVIAALREHRRTEVFLTLSAGPPPACPATGRD